MSKATSEKGLAALAGAVSLLAVSLGVALPDAAEAGADRPDAALRANSFKDSTFIKRESAPIAPKEKNLEAKSSKRELPDLQSRQTKYRP